MVMSHPPVDPLHRGMGRLHQGTQQRLLGEDQRTSSPGLEHFEEAIQLVKLLIQLRANPGQGMTLRDLLFNEDEEKQCATAFLMATHRKRLG